MVTDQPQDSFPAKVCNFLYVRFKEFNGDMNKGLVFIPCELIDDNGKTLKKYVLQHAANWKATNSSTGLKTLVSSLAHLLIELLLVTLVKKLKHYANSLVTRIMLLTQVKSSTLGLSKVLLNLKRNFHSLRLVLRLSLLQM